MNVVNFESPRKAQERQDLLDVLEEIRVQIEAGNITELVATTMTADGEPQIHVMTKDFAGGVGMFEIGKMMFVNTINYDD